MTIDIVTKPMPLYITLTGEERDHFRNVYYSISTLYAFLEKHNIERIICEETCELIDTEEILRVKGILDGIIKREEWRGEDKV